MSEEVVPLLGEQGGSLAAPSAGAEGSSHQFRLSPLKCLFIAVSFYCMCANVLVTGFVYDLNELFNEVYFIVEWPNIGLDVVECTGAVVFGLMLSRLKFQPHQPVQWYQQLIVPTVMFTLIITIFFGCLVWFKMEATGLVWTVGFISNFFYGGCILTMTTLLAWNTTHQNSPYWFGLLGCFRAAAVNFGGLVQTTGALLATLIICGILGIILLCCIMLSNLHSHVRYLVPAHPNYGRRCLFENTLSRLYLGQALFSLVAALYGSCEIVFLGTYLSILNSYSIVIAVMVGGAAASIHRRWGMRNSHSNYLSPTHEIHRMETSKHFRMCTVVYWVYAQLHLLPN